MRMMTSAKVVKTLREKVSENKAVRALIVPFHPSESF